MHRSSVCMLLSLAALGCTDAGARTVAPTVRDSAGVTIVENAGDLWNVPARWRASSQPLVRIGAVQGEEPYLFDGVGSIVVLSDDRFVVANSGDRTIRWYDADGRFLFQRGGEGEGPGEFSHLGSLSLLPGDTIVAVDWSGHRFTPFGPDGEVGPTRRIEGMTAPPGRMFRLGSGEWVFGTSGFSTAQLPPDVGPGVYRADSPVLRLSSDGARVDTLGMFPSTEVQVIPREGGLLFGPSRFGRRMRVAVVDDMALVATETTFRLDLFSRDGTLVRSIRAPDVDLALTPEIRDAYIAFLREDTDDEPDEDRAELERMIADMEFPATMPAHSTVLVDDESNVWVGEYRYDNGPPQEYLVFDHDGAFIGRASVPPGMVVMAIDDDRIWGRMTDELGVEYVVAYALEQVDEAD